MYIVFIFPVFMFYCRYRNVFDYRVLPPSASGELYNIWVNKWVSYMCYINFLKCKANSEFKKVSGSRDCKMSVYPLLWLYLILNSLMTFQQMGEIPSVKPWRTQSMPALSSTILPLHMLYLVPHQLLPFCGHLHLSFLILEMLSPSLPLLLDFIYSFRF